MKSNHRTKRIIKVEEARPLVVEKTLQPKTIAAIPCFNEELYIGSVVLRAKEYVDQVIVIDDGSMDKTALVAGRANALVIKHSSNEGKGAAIRTAFDYAKEAGCKALVLLDGDGQHDPTYIPSLLKPVLDGKADMAVGSRYLGMRSSVPGYRTWGHSILNLFTNLGSGVKLTDSQSGFRAFSLKAIETLGLAEEGLSVESEMQFLAKEAELKLTEIPVGMGYHAKAKRSPLAHGVGVLNSIMGLISRRIPLFFFGIPGLVMVGLGLWQGWRVVQGWESERAFWLGPALMAVLFSVVGVLSLFTGIILNTMRSFFK